MTTNENGFATTRWTMIAAAGAGAGEALQALCTAYWRPIYTYVRRRGYGREDAEDLTQGFFAKLLERNGFAGLDRERGRFRAFLLASLKHFLSNARDRAKTAKRGGAAIHLSLDWEMAEARFAKVDSSCLSPDEAFDREWAIVLLERVLGLLAGEQREAGNAAEFEALTPFLTGDPKELRYAEAATALGKTEAALRVQVHRLRKRYRMLLRREVGQTLADPAAVEDELRMLLKAFS